MEFPNNIPTGGTAFTLLDHFLVFAHEDAQLGEIPCTVHLQAGLEEPYYETEIDVNITVSLDQYGFEFPTGGMTLKAYAQEGDNIDYSTTATKDQEIWAVNATFAF